MFCGKCGVENQENARFCRACGAEIKANRKTAAESSIGEGTPLQGERNAAVQYETSNSMAMGSQNKHKKVGIIAVAIIVIVALVAGIALFSGGKGYEKVAGDCVDAFINMDASKIVDLIPDKMVDSVLEEYGYHSGDVDAFVGLLEDELMGAIGYLEDYIDVNYEITYEVTGASDVSADTLRSIQDMYSVYEIKVSDAKYVDVMITIASGEQTVTETITIPVMKTNGGWYLELANFR